MKNVTGDIILEKLSNKKTERKLDANLRELILLKNKNEEEFNKQMEKYQKEYESELKELEEEKEKEVKSKEFNKI